MKVIEYLENYHAKQFHIFDSHQESMGERGVDHKDQDFVVYSSNVHKNNKPKPGDLFLYRRPGKSSKTRKFYIYGGGVIKDISAPDPAGNVLAEIMSPFKLDEPLIQRESKLLEDFEWTSKKKEPGSWNHFWNQYGMNVIDEHDFYGLVGELDCSVPEYHSYLPASALEAAEEDVVENIDISPKGFDVEFADDGRNMSTSTGNRKLVTGTHINYDAVQKTKSTIGKAGELLIVELLREQFEGTDVKVEHTSVEKGDGLGYDIIVYHSNGKEDHIEVKTTKSSYVDGFYITPRELNDAHQCEVDSNKNYLIYRVYNYDSKNKRANIKIYEGPFKDENYRFEAVSWKVYEK